VESKPDHRSLDAREARVQAAHTSTVGHPASP
jgi:hypothetical protein